MNRRNFLASLSASVPAVLSAAAAPGALFAAPKTETNTAPHTASLSTPMAARYRLTLDRVLHGTGPAYTTEFLLEDIRNTGQRRFTNFSGDVSGRWIGALSSAALVYGESFPVLDSSVRQIIALQHPEGYFGKIFHYVGQNDDDMALLWGNGRLLVGLMEYYGYKQDATVLAAARKLGDFLVRIGPDFNTQKKADEFGAAHYGSSYICWTQQTEGLAALYAVTKDARYLDLCTDISKRIERRTGDHVHGHLCALRGLVDMYAASGDKALLDKARLEWQSITDSGELVVTGGVPERWAPLRTRTEGCAECDWMRLGLSLYRATGDTRYIESAERAMFNEFAMNQFASGDFGHGELDASGAPFTVKVRAWWCCTLHGLRAFSDVQRSAFRLNGKDAAFDLPVDAAIDWQDFAARSTSLLAENGSITIQVTKSSSHSLTLRQPSWASSMQLTHSGRKVPGLRIENVRAGDVITAKYAMGLREASAGIGAAAGRTALSYGPWLLGICANDNAGFFGEHVPTNQVYRGSDKPATEAASSPFAVPVAATTLGYVSAEFPDQPGRVRLRAVAEQTALLPTVWDTTLLMTKAATPAAKG